MPNKKRIYFFIVLYFVFVINMQAQNNLMVDGSFEDVNSPPTVPECYQMLDLKNWIIPNNLNAYTNYYNTKSIYKMCRPNYNYVLYQVPRDGFGVAAFYPYREGFPDIARGYVQGSLTEVLITGKRYEVKFYVSLANFYGMSVSKIGALLTTEPITFTYRCEQVPQVESNRHLTDTLNWMEIKGEFVAQGGEKHITIGNFRTDAESDTLKVLTHSESSNIVRTGYYTLDDVSVICLDCPTDEVGVSIVEQNQKPKNVVFNTSTNTLNVSEWGTLVIYNMQGVKVRESSVVSQQVVSVSAENLGAAGVYIWQFKTEKEVQQGKFVISE